MTAGFGTQTFGTSSFGGARDITLTVGEPTCRTLSASLVGGTVELSPLDRVYASIPVAAALADGTATTISGVDVALLPGRSDPDAATVWTSATYANGVATVLIAGPAADPTDALVCSGGYGALWVRVTDIPEVQAVKAGPVIVI